MDEAWTGPRRIVAIVPVGDLAGAKSRLGETLDAEERLDLAKSMLRRTLAATMASPHLAETLVVSPDRAALALASELGARTLRQRGRGLNEGLRAARADALAGGADAIVILPIDLPAIDAAAVASLLKPLQAGPGVVLVADRHGLGTNALALRPPDAIEVAFGPESRQRHRSAAHLAGARLVELGGALSLDLDTPEDLLLAGPAALSTELPRAQPAADALSVLAVDGLPEVIPGDDLPTLIAAALDDQLAGRPLRDGDVLVVTQKIVSKAEGAIVDLDAVEPRPEAVDFAQRFDRDPRQVEVVLREARRVVRMANGVIITETHHGFVCANGGIDASNVGPASGSIVTLLPIDPDRSAGAIRAAIRDRLGHDLPVIISDSFGRPWRYGIVDVAIGVSGLLPLEDLRGQPDADGRVMRSTIRAVADELASAAELVLGKTAGRPMALIRGATYVRGEGRISDSLMPAAMDLFR